MGTRGERRFVIELGCILGASPQIEKAVDAGHTGQAHRHPRRGGTLRVRCGTGAGATGNGDTGVGGERGRDHADEDEQPHPN